MLEKSRLNVAVSLMLPPVESVVLAWISSTVSLERHS